MVLDVCLDPPDSVRNQTHSLVWVELSHCHHKADIAFLDEVKHFKAIVPEFVGNFYHKSQVGSNQRMGGRQLFVFKKRDRMTMFILFTQKRKPAYFVHIKAKTVSYNRQLSNHDE
jgi:hypothetical protein